jgi:hypothetical protein
MSPTQPVALEVDVCGRRRMLIQPCFGNTRCKQAWQMKRLQAPTVAATSDL